MGATFDVYVGIDYSGAATAESRLPGLQVYRAGGAASPRRVAPPGGARHWCRRQLAAWLVEGFESGFGAGRAARALVGIDHGFGFPRAYFEAHQVETDWRGFVEDFRRHWPTDRPGVRVEDVRRGRVGAGAARGGDPRWRRIAERRAGGAKSVFHFDVPGSVAKSTHAGLPWLGQVAGGVGTGLHVWPFDGWDVPPQHSAIFEAYPALYGKDYPRGGRSADEHDAYAIARWLREADGQAALQRYWRPSLRDDERGIAALEGWILGVA